MSTLQPCNHSAAVAEIYTFHHGWLRGWLAGKLGCSHRAADIAQDTFVRVLQRAAPVTGEPRALLTTIAKGLVVDHWRRASLEQAYLDVLSQREPDYTPSAEETHAILQLLERLATMLEGLKPNVRDAFLLSQLQGMRYADIALQLNVSRRSVERYIATAMYHCYQLRYESAL